MKTDKMKREKKPWPTKDAMVQIYEKNLWGGKNADFYSGTGSHQTDLVEPYICAVSSFLGSFDDSLVVCDLGCGDFNVGRRLVKHAKKYIAADIVPGLIERNKRKFRADNLEFRCMDIAAEEWPSGDCVILRQVLQHLSNAEIQRIVNKLAVFRYVILTEHLPEGDFIPNKDIISGQGTRLKINSGVNLQVPPFDFRAKREKRLTAIPSREDKGELVTILFET
ncbi:class I SAM-dependent methyltransferase [Rhodohalobacter mucosus]|uniref:SAM-dependent methyltransferase n=1 Tax=Rhodohalobacter mucosus TaxID=2079485 RepID=A0A316TN23_9BACT|nr:class I SAM-dependent methyltransferase [Rhodohalobacter mucosus]PWN06013.1 SAM-dependent methyltransferase [Rhodohalobacter mucosus]